MSSFADLFRPFLVLLAEDPVLRALQLFLLAGGFLAIFLVMFVTRDILQRTRSFSYQLLSIALVALLPIVGFFLYLLVRPARSLREREMEEMLKKLVERE